MFCISTKPELSILSYCPLSAAHAEGVLTDWCLMNEFLLHCIYLLWVVVYSRTVDFIWNSEDNFQGSVVCFHHVGLRDGTQVISLGSKHHYPLIHLANPYEVVLKPCLGYSLAINYCHLLFEKVMLTCQVMTSCSYPSPLTWCILSQMCCGLKPILHGWEPYISLKLWDL